MIVNGDWQGQDGQVALNAALGGDGSVTDKLIINGSAGGTTLL